MYIYVYLCNIAITATAVTNFVNLTSQHSPCGEATSIYTYVSLEEYFFMMKIE